MAVDRKKLSVYHLGDCLGKGAFGAVYRGLNLNTGETVAVKQIKLHNIPKTELKVIMMEIDLLKNLNHPNIVKYHGYCENGSLQSICKTFGKFPENLVAVYITQVLHGLLYLHDQGVIHRDIKGANILTTKEGFVKLADFGVATRTSSLSGFTVVGSPYWMAPEVIELSGVTTASDIWSVGCTVIELLEGKPPYHKLDQMPALFRIVTRDFLMQCFQKDPNLRVSAKKLLKHPWLVKQGRLHDKVVSQSTSRYDDVIKSVQQWNAALKSPDIVTIRKTSAYSTQPFKSIDFCFSANENKELTLKHISEVNRLKTEAFRSPDDSNDRDQEVEKETLANFSKLNVSPNEDFEDNMKTIRPIKNIKLDNKLSLEKKLNAGLNESNKTVETHPSGIEFLSNKYSKNTTSFHHGIIEDYSDLVLGNEHSFAQKRDNLASPRLFHPNDIKMLSQSSHALTKPLSCQNSSVLSTENNSFSAANCSTEISQYIEHDDDETDYSNIFTHLNQRDEQGDDVSDEDDLFLQINEGFEEMDANIAREQQARTAERVMFLIGSLKVDQDESSLITRCSDLV
ncbi:hypothetical protein PMAC_000820 [Pneumocystis sp. 'macacae']|nr:hypothetical protein PMAC_000820 [Pneumocystis sp. 'macacae']